MGIGLQNSLGFKVEWTQCFSSFWLSSSNSLLSDAWT